MGIESSVQKRDPAGFNVVDGADEIHETTALLLLDPRSVQNLAHGPADVGPDGLREQSRGCRVRVEVRDPGENGIEKELNVGVLRFSMQPGVDGGVNGAAVRVAQDDEERRSEVLASV